MRVLAGFILGLVIGALSIGGALWSTGRLRIAHQPPWLRTVPAAPPGPAVPDTSASVKLPAPPVPPPEQQTPPPAQGFAERTAPESAATTAATGRATTGPAALNPAPPLHLAMPLAGIDPKGLTDTFNQARKGHKHEALDIMAPKGTPVLAVAEGNVVKLFTSKPGGLTVYQFDDSRQYEFYYGHLDHYAPNLKEGMLLRKGDTLGYVGTTGNAPPNAPHLHLGVFKLGPEKEWWKGTPLDPLPMLK